MPKDELKGSKALPVVGVEEFEALAKDELTVFDNAVVTKFRIIDYIDKKTSVPRKIALVDLQVNDSFRTSGVTSVSNVEFMMKLGTWNVIAEYTGSRFNDYSKEDQPTFDIGIGTNA